MREVKYLHFDGLRWPPPPLETIIEITIMKIFERYVTHSFIHLKVMKKLNESEILVNIYRLKLFCFVSWNVREDIFLYLDHKTKDAGECGGYWENLSLLFFDFVNVRRVNSYFRCHCWLGLHAYWDTETVNVRLSKSMLACFCICRPAD